MIRGGLTTKRTKKKDKKWLKRFNHKGLRGKKSEKLLKTFLTKF